MGKPLSVAFAEFRDQLKALIKKAGIATPDGRWAEEEILDALTKHFEAPTPDIDVMAQIAYEGYRAHTGGISVATGQTIPEWKDLKNPIKDAWKASTIAVVKSMLGQQASK